GSGRPTQACPAELPVVCSSSTDPRPGPDARRAPDPAKGRHGQRSISSLEPKHSPNAMTRYYPGFFAALMLILLRVAIGWHFLYEGMEKYESTQHGKDAFSAEIYLRNANGPLAEHFR